MHVRLRLSVALAVVIPVCLLFPGSGGAAERIYVLSQTGATLSAIADGADKASFSIPLDKAPAAFVIDGGLAYVTHPDLGKVSVVDLEQRRVRRTIDVPGSPFGIAIAKDGRLFVGDWNGAHVSVIGGDGKISKTVEVGRAPAHILLTPDQKQLIVANRESDSISVVRTDDLAVTTTIPVGRAPFAIALSPDARRLYAGNVQGGTTSVIDMTTLAVVETLPSGAMPYGIAVAPSGSPFLVTNQQAGTVAVMEAVGGAITPVKVGGYPEGVAVSADGAKAYVANWFSDDVSVIDLATLKEIRRVKCAGGPRGIVISNEMP